MFHRPQIVATIFSMACFFAAHFAAANESAYVQTTLIANQPSYNPTIMVDPHLINPWGIALRPPGAGGHFWISNAGDGTTTTYIGDVIGNPLHQDGLKVLPIQQATGVEAYKPQVTGQVYNAASDIPGQPIEFFVAGPANDWSTTPPTAVSDTSGSAKFVFVTTDGTINAWRSGTNPGMREAVVMKHYDADWAKRNSYRFTPNFTGVAMTTDASRTDDKGSKVADNRLYTVDFANGLIITFDNQWRDISEQVRFERPKNLQHDFMPYNIQYIAGRLYVVYAENSEEADVPFESRRAPASGRVVAYDCDGHIVQDFPEQLPLNSPWGVALAPQSFGNFGGKLLVGNFGDGTIAGYDPDNGAYIGQLRDASGKPVIIDGLWGMAFGNGVSLGDANSLYYTAGPNSELDGVFGKLTVAVVSAQSSSRDVATKKYAGHLNKPSATGKD